jgi:signal transduction histidine kinase/CheY-like chemotaxis protein
MLRHLREPYLIASAGGKIVAANVAAAEALGTSIVALQGASLEVYSPDPVSLRERLADPLADAPFPLRGRDGRRFSCDKSSLPGALLLRLSGGPEGARRAGAFNETLTQLHGASSSPFMAQAVEELSRGVLARGMQSLGVVAAGLYLVDATGANLELKGSVGYSDENVDRFRLIPLTASTPATDSIKNRLPVLLGSPEAIAARYPAFSNAYTARRAVAIACIPLEVQGRAIGSIGLGFAQPRTFDEKEQDALRALGQQCAGVFEWADRLEGRVPSSEQAPSPLERLHVFTRALAQAVTPTHVAEAVVDMGMAATSAQSGGLWLLSEDGSTVTLERIVGPGGPRSENYVRVPLDTPQPMAVLDAIREGRPVWLESSRQIEARYPETFRRFSQGGECALACLPLFAQGRCIGGLAYHFEGSHRFDEEERTFLHLISWHSAHAIERSRLYREAREADRQKDEFLAMLSHELRNPLTPIIAAVELMELRDNSAFAKERTIIARNARHIVRLVDDLLEVARLKRGKIVLRPELCELSTLITNAVETMNPLVEAHAQHLEVSDAAPGVVVKADPVRLTQAIVNLLANAVKYTRRGGEISVVALAEGSEAVVRVRDSGIGISPEMLPRVFDLFAQEKGALDRAQGGLGIGLTVVKTLVELHGGRVSAHSEGRTRGSEFVIRLPLASDDAPAVAASTTAPPRRVPVEHRLRVLIVDDNSDAANLVGDALGVLGCLVRIAYDGASALVAAVEFEPELALVDIGLPILNGYEVAERLRRLDVPPRSIVAVSGYGQHADRLRSREAGFDDHIVKPVGLDILRKLVTAPDGERAFEPSPEAPGTLGA